MRSLLPRKRNRIPSHLLRRRSVIGKSSHGEVGWKKRNILVAQLSFLHASQRTFLLYLFCIQHFIIKRAEFLKEKSTIKERDNFFKSQLLIGSNFGNSKQNSAIAAKTIPLYAL